MTKTQKDTAVKEKAINALGLGESLVNVDAMQVASSSWLVSVGEVDGVERYAEIKVIAKAEDFDLADALNEFEDKQKKAAERQAAQAKRKAEAAAKKAKKEAEKAAKEVKEA